MRNHLKYGLAMAAVVTVSAISPAYAATTVNFDQSTDPTSYATQGLVLNGFSIASNTYGGAVILPSSPNYASVSSTGGTISFVNSNGQATTSDGFGFTTVGLNAGSGFYNGAVLTFLGAMGNVLGTQTFSPVGPDAARSPIEYSNTYSGISSVSFAPITNSSGQGLFAIDNVNFTTNAVEGAVPESAAWMMMILGMGAVGFAMRRSKQAVRVTYA